MKIELINKEGVTLKTKGKYIEEDIDVGLSYEDKEALVEENIAEGVTLLGLTGTHKGESGVTVEIVKSYKAYTIQGGEVFDLIETYKSYGVNAELIVVDELPTENIKVSTLVLETGQDLYPYYVKGDDIYAYVGEWIKASTMGTVFQKEIKSLDEVVAVEGVETPLYILKESTDTLLTGTYDGSTVELKELNSNSNEGTTVPNTGKISEVYFNTSLSVVEVQELASKLTYHLYEALEPILFTQDSNGDILNLIYLMYNQDDGMTVIMSQNPPALYFSSVIDEELGNDFVGWNPAITYPIAISGELVSSDSDLPIGSQNEMINSLFSTTPFGETGVISLKPYIKKQKLPLKFKLDFLPKIVLDSKVNAPVPNSGYVENVYFNTSMSVDEVINLLDTAQTDMPGAYFLLANENMSYALVAIKDNPDDANPDLNFWIIADLINATCYFSERAFQDEGLGNIDFVGWNPAITYPIDIKSNVLPVVNIDGEVPFGTHNAEIVSLFYTKSVGKPVDLIGEYDGSSIELTENTTLDIKSMIENDKRIPLSVNVNVAGSGGSDSNIEALIDGSITGEITSNVETIRAAAFCECSKLTSVNIPNATSIGNEAFLKCGVLTSVNIPNATIMGSRPFYNCYNLSIVKLDSITKISSQAFYACNCLKRLIIRQTDSVCTLANKNAFTGCCYIHGTVDATFNPNGDKDGYIFVPDSLLDQYKSATNWSDLADQIKPLSDYVE